MMGKLWSVVLPCIFYGCWVQEPKRDTILWVLQLKSSDFYNYIYYILIFLLFSNKIFTDVDKN